MENQDFIWKYEVEEGINWETMKLISEINVLQYRLGNGVLGISQVTGPDPGIIIYDDSKEVNEDEHNIVSDVVVKRKGCEVESLYEDFLGVPVILSIKFPCNPRIKIYCEKYTIEIFKDLWRIIEREETTYA